jgi:hypothetical protein
MPVRPLRPNKVYEYHVFLASPGDLEAERQAVREFFQEYNETTARWRNIRFTVVDWENFASAGVGRTQELITEQTLEQFRDSLALVIALMGQRFGTPTGQFESGTEEEYNWALESFTQRGFPDIKWFFRESEHLVVPRDPVQARAAIDQWERVLRFRVNVESKSLSKTFKDLAEFRDSFRRDIAHWLNNTARSWNKGR